MERTHLPAAFAERMKELLGDQYEAYVQAMEKEPVRGFRINPAKATPQATEALRAFGARPIPYVEDGYYLDDDTLGSHPYHHAGAVYIQEPGAMAPAACLELQPDWRVLDLCAAPGGKSSQLRAKLGEDGVLVSNEIVSSRCRILTGNVERLGLCNVVTTCTDAAHLAALFPKAFDLLVVDAPCSGEGMFRKEPIAVEEWSEENVRMCAARQASILEDALGALKDGGYLLYATCTFSLDENEKTVDDFLFRHPEFELLPVAEAVQACTVPGIRFEGCRCERIDYTRRFYPHTGAGEGQFMALLHSTREPSEELPARSKKGKSKDARAKKPSRPDAAVFAFLDDVLEHYDPAQVRLYNGNPVYFTPDFDLPDGAAFSCGVTLFEPGKSFLQPHHQFFMALGRDFRRKIELTADSEALARYLHGEEIDADCGNGWAVVTVDGCAVGGAKVVGGRAKNHYPKGLRTK